MKKNGNIDEELLLSLKKGDRKAFDTLIRQYYPRLMGYSRIMVDEEPARDIVQDVFLYLWDNRTRFDFTPGLHSYLYKMCYSRCVDFLRRANVVDIEDVAFGRLMEDELEWLKSNSDDVIRVISNRDLVTRVEELIEEFPEKRREVFKLSFFHEMNNGEISEMLNMPRRTVESHLYLSLKFLRKKLPLHELLSLVLLLTLTS